MLNEKLLSEDIAGITKKANDSTQKEGRLVAGRTRRTAWREPPVGIQMGGCVVGSRHGKNPAAEQSFRREHGLLIKR